MSQLSWNEVRNNAIQFSRAWAGTTEERAEAQSFWNDFFTVFGISRRLFATFESPVVSFEGTQHRIDVFWKGTLLAEHKSAGASLDKALAQALCYVQELAASGARGALPRYIVVSDFRRIMLHDLEPEEGEPGERQLVADFALADFHEHVRAFAFMLGQKTHRFGEEDPANLEAAEIMADLHDAVKEGGYDQSFLERFLVRVLFCLFADDTGIFASGQFELYIRNQTKEDGSDLGGKLRDLFEILDTPTAKRNKYLEEDLATFPYVNGELFSEPLPSAGFNRDMRNRLLAALGFDWSRISPAIFGSLFQGIMGAKERRQIGAHYTSERDILKLIRPLFLDDLHREFEKIARLQQGRTRDERLKAFQKKLRSLRFLDPACGCGNFLVVAYRELRRLELRLLVLLHRFDRRGRELDLGEVAKLSQVDVDQFYGIEIDEWPARIAETALWLTDHQMNTELSLAAGNLYQRIPLQASPHIRCANALRMDWNDLLPAKDCAYVLGNPPFVGAKFQTPEQKQDAARIAGKIPGSGLLDYVTLWYFKAAEYIAGTTIRCAYVSTNSIAQGEQVGVLWGYFYARGFHIHFAHRPFAWQSEARGKAHVHVVIIGFGLVNGAPKRIFVYDDINGDAAETVVSDINPYLLEGPETVIVNRSRPLCDVPEIGIGNKPIDGGHYLFTGEEKRAFLLAEPGAKKFFRRWIGSVEFLHGIERWCLWLGDASPAELRDLPECRKRIEAVRRFRLESKSAPTRKLAETPRRFHVENFPKSAFLVIPEVSSERRPYIPIGFVKPQTVCSNLVKIMPQATPWHFGVLTSKMHMAWTAQVCGRLKSDFRYSAKLVYNNFPWPTEASEAQRAKVSALADRVLAARQGYLDRGSTLADLYDPLTMPTDLLKAHQALDKAVDQCYRKAPFASDRERVEHLFRLYEELTAPLAATETAAAQSKRKSRTGKPLG